MSNGDSNTGTNTTTNTSRPTEEINRTTHYVQKNDGVNIDAVIFPHTMQIGLSSDEYLSSLAVKGDLVVSGAIRGHVNKLSDGNSYIVAGSNITITSGSNGQITIASTGGGGDTFKTISVAGQSDVVADSSTDTLTLVAGSNMTITTTAGTDTITFASSGGSGGGSVTGSFNVPSPSELVTTGSVSVAGGLGFNYTADTIGTDTYFFVSGSIGSSNKNKNTDKGASVFGGDVMISGSLRATSNILSGSTPSDGQVVAWDATNGRLVWKTIVIGFAFATSLTSFNNAYNAGGFVVYDNYDPRTTSPLASGTIDNS
tara:strand:- start:2430 stop:3371 length:942 start_codon:yes stop_codon:yes gene_type:complete